MGIVEGLVHAGGVGNSCGVWWGYHCGSGFGWWWWRQFWIEGGIAFEVVLGSLLFMKEVDIVSWGEHGAVGASDDMVQVAQGGAELGQNVLG